MSTESTSQVPCSPTIAVADVVYFPRMVEKIRLHAQGVLRPDLHENLGTGVDGWLCGFLRVNYDDLKARVLQGGTDEELLAWCEQRSRPLNDTDKLLWRTFALKLGWNDRLTPRLEQRKAESGFTDRADIQTMAQYIDADEGRIYVAP
jgi:gluconokinase